MGILKNISCFILWFLLSIGAFSASASEEIHLYEEQIKAGLLYNFLKYTEWPQNEMQQAEMQVCLYGNDPFETYLQPMRKRTVNQRSIKVRRIETASDLNGCHLLFVTAREKERWPELRMALTSKSVLTVSDLEGFVHSGGMIEFGRKDSRINVALNMEAVNLAQLHVHDRLLQLVTLVRTP